MSAGGQTRRFRDARRRSGLPPTSDIFRLGRHFAFGPSADVTTLLAESLPVDSAVACHVYHGCAMVHRHGQMGPASE